jgi:hypothetical protein
VRDAAHCGGRNLGLTKRTEVIRTTSEIPKGGANNPAAFFLKSGIVMRFYFRNLSQIIDIGAPTETPHNAGWKEKGPEDLTSHRALCTGA